MGELACGTDPLLPLPFLLQGVPFPQNEANAMDVVVQFAVHRLGFQLQDIIIYAWSIGGFTGTSLPPNPTVGIFMPPSQGAVGKCTGGPGVGWKLKEGEVLSGMEEGILYIYTSHFLPHSWSVIKSRPGSWAGKIREVNVFFADCLQCTSIFSIFFPDSVI